MIPKRKKLIAIGFALIMILSGLGALASIPHPSNSQTIGSSHQPTIIPSTNNATSGGTVDAYYGVPVYFPTTTHPSHSTNSACAEKTTSSTSSYPAPDYPAYPAYPSYPGTSSESWTLDIGSSQIQNGSSPATACAHSQSQSQRYKHLSRVISGSTHYTIYYTLAYSYSYSTTSWDNSIAPEYTPESGGSPGGTNQTWTISLDGTTSSGTLDIFSPVLTVTSSASPTGIDEGQSLSLNESVSNGAGGNTYAWSASGASGSFSSTTASNPTWTASGTGSVTFTLTVTQSGGYTFQGTTSAEINSDPAVTISSSPSTSDVGQRVDFSTAASGGSGTYSSYSYVLYDGTSTSDSQLTSGTTSSFSYTFASAGQFLLDYSVTDSNGYTKTTSLTQIVNTDPSVSISSSQNPTDTGKSITLTASVSGGTTPYSYQWYEDSNAVSGATSSTYSPGTYSASGTYNYYVEITDAAGYSVDSNTITETVNSGPTVSASSNVSSADVNYPIEFSASPSGGTSPYSYSWTLSGTQVSTSQDFSYTFTTAGSYTMEATVTDSVGETYSASVTVTINNNPSVSITSSQNPTDAGNSVTFTASETGGTGAISYAWTINGASEGSGSTLSYSFSSSGTYTVDVTVTDSDSHTATYSLSETVYSDPSVSVSSSQNPTDIGNSVTFTASASGGSGSYTYQWYLNSASISGATSSTYTTSFSSSGTEEFYVIIHDSVGNSAQSSTLDETVNVDPSVSISSSQNPTDVGNSVTFTASATGGTGSYSYQWYVGGTAVSGATSSSYTTSFSSSGTDSVYVIIHDGLGDSATSSTISETVNTDPSVSISSSQNPTDVGNSVTFTASVKGGTSSYSYAWTINGASQSSTSSAFSNSFASAGNYYVNVTVTDSLGDKATYSLKEVVYSDPSVSVSSSQNPTDVGNSITFKSLGSGGYGAIGLAGATVYPITLSGVPSGTGYYQQLLTISNPSNYGINTNGSNIEFSAQNGTLLYAWIQSISSTSMQVWVKNYNDSSTIDMQVLPSFENLFSATGYLGKWGTSTDNGALVFTKYWSFTTSSLPSSWSITNNGGFTTNYTATGLYMNQTETSVNGEGIISDYAVSEPSTIVFSGKIPVDVNAAYDMSGFGLLPVLSPSVSDISIGTNNNVGEIVVNPDKAVLTNYQSYARYNNTWEVSYNNPTITAQLNGGDTYISSFAQSATLYPAFYLEGDGNSNYFIRFVAITQYTPSMPTLTIGAGVPAYTYQWYDNGTAVSGATNSTYTTSFSSSGSDSVYVVITDGAGNTAQSNTITETVNVDPSVTITSSQNPTDVGNSITFTATVTGGTSPYTYAWYNSGTLESSTSSTYTTSFSSSGTYVIEVIIKDANGNKAYYNFTETVNVDPSVSITSSQNPTDVGNSVTFTASASGGSGSYTYQWYYASNNTAISGATGYEYTRSFSTSGTYSFYVIIHDGNGNAAQSSTLDETVNADPSVSISESPSPTDVGVSVTFTSSASGGTGSYNYTWTIDGKTYYTQSVTVVFGTSGTYTAQLTIRDTLGDTASASESIVVNQDPTVSISAEYSTVYSKTNDTLSASGDYGTGTYNYTWYNGTTIIGYGHTLIYKWGSKGNYTISVEIKDSLGETYTTSIIIQVVPHPDIFIAGPLKVTVGQSNTWSMVASHLTINGNVEWYNDGTSASDTTPFFTFSYPVADVNETIEVSYDVQGKYYNSTITIHVYGKPKVSISETDLTTDVGLSDSFSAITSSGTPGYTFVWTVDGQSFDSQDFTYSFSSSGTHLVKVTATDGDGVSVSAEANITVNADPSVTISTSNSQYDLGYSITFTASTKDGTRSYTYQWYLNGNAVSGATSSTYTTSFTASGTDSVYVIIQDSLGVSATSNHISVDIKNQPSVTVSASRHNADTGQVISFDSAVFNGTGPYTYEWFINSGSVSTQASFSYTFTTAGSYTIKLTVTDSDGYSSSASVTVIVSSDPSVSISTPHSKIDIGYADSFSAAATGGLSPYSYEWLYLGNSISTSSSLSYSFNSAGNKTIEVIITDANGYNSYSNITVLVVSHPFVQIGEKYNSLDVNVQDIFTSTVEYGSAPYNYTWYVGSVSVGYGSSLSYTFTTAGSYTVKLTVTDIDGYSYTASKGVTVVASPSVSILANYHEIDQGMTIDFLSGVQNGTGPYNYTWSIGTVAVGYSSSLSYAFSTSGTYTVSVTVKDSFGESGKASITITVNSPISVSASVKYNSIDAGQNGIFTGSVTGGTGPYSYSWAIDGNVISSQQMLTYSFINPGTYTITFTATDSFGKSASYSLSIKVNPSLSGALNITYTTVDTNITDTITLTAKNGTGPYTYAILINGKLVSSIDSYSQYFTSPGTFLISAYINDSQGESIHLKGTITVRNNPKVYIVSPTNKTDQNVPVKLRSILSGGTGPYTYEWIIGGHTYSNATLTYSFSTVGQYSIELTVSDVFGREAITEINETIVVDPHATLVVLPDIKASVEEPMCVNITGGIPAYKIQWYFPDGEQYTGKSITHAFGTAGRENFQVQVGDSTGYSETQNFTVNVGLYVTISANQTRGIGPLSVQFSSSVLGGSSYSYNWTFSPGHSNLEPNPSYTFPVGNYTVHFTATANNGAIGQKNLTIQSLPEPVTFLYSTDLNITQAFHFRAVPNWDAEAPYSASWSFPNGQQLTGLNISYKFPVYSEFNKVLATFTFNGKSYSQILTVRMIPANPIISFKLPKIIPVDTLLSLNATASAPDSSSFTYQWTINGHLESGQDQFYYFSSVKNYSVSLTVTDSLGATTTISHYIDVVALESNTTIVIGYHLKTIGPDDYYTIKVQSTDGIDITEAFLGDNQLTLTLINETTTSSGTIAYYNLTLLQSDYPAGAHSLNVISFNSQSQSNHVTIPFSVSSQYSSSSFSFETIIQFFGGFSNFLVLILTLAGVVIAYSSLNREANPDVVIQETGKKGKTKSVVLKGRRKK
ncbi:MAG: PKD domain-containing protein [Thermoplasmatales archaeon]|nr:MAG: PKD domain-containing protein [Thermoplasmatales archaeon]